MQVRTFDDPRSFLDAVGPMLVADEPRHNLLLGLSSTLVTRPDEYDSFRLWEVRREDTPVLVGMMTPPFPLVISRPLDPGAFDALIAHLGETGVSPPGVEGAIPEVDVFASRWAEATGVRATTLREEGVYALEAVETPAAAPGGSKAATPDDLDLLERWIDDFSAEALPHEPPDGGTRQRLAARLDGAPDAGIWLWEVGDLPVSMSSFGGPTPNGIRIGPVYTPPAHRGNGYATSLVAEQSAALLSGGRRFCFLFTDMANPTSNALYRRIGYREVCRAANVRFERA